jgi:hypothetical protein
MIHRIEVLTLIHLPDPSGQGLLARLKRFTALPVQEVGAPPPGPRPVRAGEHACRTRGRLTPLPNGEGQRREARGGAPQ